MKGKQLFYDDLMNLPVGTKVWVEYDLNEWTIPWESGIETIEEYSCGDRYTRATCMKQKNSTLNIFEDGYRNTKYYEWIE